MYVAWNANLSVELVMLGDAWYMRLLRPLNHYFTSGT